MMETVMVTVDPDQAESQDLDHLESPDQDRQENHPGQKMEASPLGVFI